MLVLLTAVAMAAAPPEKPKLQLLTEEYPPLTFSDRGKPSGLATEIVREMLRRSGHEATIEVVPWARGYAVASKTPNVGLFATSRIPEREGIFNLETVVGRVCRCVRGGVWREATTRQAPACKEERQSQAPPRMRRRMRSGLTHWVKPIERGKRCKHWAPRSVTSGQPRFLGSSGLARWRPPALSCTRNDRCRTRQDPLKTRVMSAALRCRGSGICTRFCARKTSPTSTSWPIPVRRYACWPGGRVSLAAVDEVTFNETSAKEGIPVDSVRPIVPMVGVKQYLVFSQDTDDAIVRDLQRAFDSLRADGTLLRLYRQWLPGVPPPD